jgi:hypothetical protein
MGYSLGRNESKVKWQKCRTGCIIETMKNEISLMLLAPVRLYSMFYEI